MGCADEIAYAVQQGKAGIAGIVVVVVCALAFGVWRYETLRAAGIVRRDA
jgi:hypothetical protein